MRQTLVGMVEDHEKLVTNALDDTHNHDLSHIFEMVFDIVDGFTSLVLKEMFSTRSEIIYWEKLRKISNWEILITQWNSKIFRTVTFQKGIPDTILEKEKGMNIHIESLRADFNELAVLLAKLFDSSKHLKGIFNIVQCSALYNEKFRMHAKVSLLIDGNEKCDRDGCQSLRDVVSKELESSIKILLHSIQYHFPQKHMEPSVKPFYSHTLWTTQDMNACCSALHSKVHSLMKKYGDETFPLQFSGDIVRRPSNIERFWIRNLFFAFGTVYGCSVLVGMIKDGSLQEFWHHSKELVSAKVAEHVVEPLTKLKQELFETIRSSDDHIVAKRDLELSKAALERMLTDFSKSKEGHALILPNIQEAKEEILRNKERIFTKEGVADVVNAMKTPPKSDVPPVHTVESIRTGDALVDLSPTPEQALIALMNEYEKDLQHPIRGIMFGNLFTAILIQVQKLKVHTEAAMLKMDQILASNELTIAATAAMPAFGLVGLLLYNLRAMFTPKAQSGGKDAMHFQLILADVERSLQEVREAIRTEDTRVFTLTKEDVVVLPHSPSRRRQTEQALLNGEETQIGIDGGDKFNDPGSSVSPVVPYGDRTTWIAKGIYYFNLVRLRSKFHELFEVISPLSSAKAQSVSVYEIKWKGHNRSPESMLATGTHHSIATRGSLLLQSFFHFFKAIHNLLFGSNELMSQTTPYHSLNKDITLLESPDAEVSLQQKIETAKRMRLSYKILSPLHV